MTEKLFELPENLNATKKNGEDLTVEDVRDILNELIKSGYGDYELWVGYDSNYCYTDFTDRISVIDDIEVVKVKEKPFW